MSSEQFEHLCTLSRALWFVSGAVGCWAIGTACGRRIGQFIVNRRQTFCVIYRGETPLCEVKLRNRREAGVFAAACWACWHHGRDPESACYSVTTTYEPPRQASGGAP